jgi:hypothetical protein
MTTLKSDLRPSSQADVAFGPGPFATWQIGTVTAAQVNNVAMKRIECFLPASTALGMGRSTQSADAMSICDTQSYNVPVSVVNEDITFDIWRYLPPSGTDDAWVMFDDQILPRVPNFLIDCPAGFSGTLGVAAVGDKVDVYNVLIGSRGKSPRSKDSLQMGTVTLTVIGAIFGVVLT